jgi:hypothetical protein
MVWESGVPVEPVCGGFIVHSLYFEGYKRNPLVPWWNGSADRLIHFLKTI